MMKQRLEITSTDRSGDSVQFTAIIRAGWRESLAQLMGDLFPGEMYAYAIKGNELNVTIR